MAKTIAYVQEHEYDTREILEDKFSSVKERTSNSRKQLNEYSCAMKSHFREIWKSEFRYSEIAYFVLDDLSISVWILVKTLPHLRCVAVFTNVSTEIMIRYAQKTDLKSDFHITGQLM